MSNLFISYRREDGGPYAGRIHDRLIARFGAAAIFIDVDDIAPGADFVRTLEDRLADCRAALVVIGPRWLTAAAAGGARRLDDPQDYVRLEVETALRRSIRVIPVLVGGAAMPSASELPPPLAALARRQAFAVRDDAFHADMERLIETVASAAAGATAAAMTGRWLGQARSAAGQPYTVRFEFDTLDGTLFGRVDYPTGSAGILDGTISGDAVAFRTVHIPQFEQEPAEIRFRGKLDNGELVLVMQSADGATRVTARPAATDG